MVTCVAQVAESLELWAVLPGVALLSEPVPTVSDHAAYQGAVFSFRPDVELMIRRAETTVGGTLNSNLSLCSGKVWRCMTLPTASVDSLVSATSGHLLRLDRKHVTAMGVTAQSVSSVNELVPSYEGSDGARLQEQDAPVLEASLEAPSSSLSGVIQAVGDAERALQRLHGLARVRTSGMVTHDYPPEVILMALALNQAVRPQTSIARALSLAAPFFFGSEHCRDLQTDLTSGAVSLPSEGVMRRSNVRLDILSVLYRRVLFSKFSYWRYLNPDSSPQLGHDWLVCREDSFQFEKGADSDEQLSVADYNRAYSSRCCLLSTIGRGRGSLVAKSFKLGNIHKMESETEQDEADLRAQVYGLVADQGTESGCADIDVMKPIIDEIGSLRHDDACCRQYPNCIYMPEHLHMLFNALQHAVESIPEHRLWIVRLRALERFLSDRSLRRLFVATCLIGHPEAWRFKYYSTVEINWRWEMLSKALDCLIPLFDLMMHTLDLEKLTKTDGSDIDPNLARDAHATLHMPDFLPLSELIRQTGNSIESTAHRLEACECHRSLWMSKTSWVGKTRTLERQTGYDHCYLKSRQGPWFQMEGRAALMNDVQNCSSDLLEKMLLDMDGFERGRFTLLQARLHDKLVAELQHKTQFHDECPYSAIGVFYGEVTGREEDVQRCRRRLVDNIAQYDGYIAAGVGDRLHRVAHKLYGHGECRRQLLLFGSSANLPLIAFPAAYCMIKKYAMVPLVGRRVEAQHAQIKQIGRQANHVSPPFISAAVASPSNLKAVENNQEFRSFCLRRWRSPTVLTDTLRLVIPRTTLLELTPDQKVQRIYQCALDDEYRPMAQQKAQHGVWLRNTEHTRAKTMSLPLSAKAGVHFIKAKLSAPGLIFSLPSDLHNLALQTGDALRSINVGDMDAWGGIVQAVQQPIAQFSWESARGCVFFEVTNAYPEKRHLVPLHHLDPRNDCVDIVARRVIGIDVAGEQVALMSTCDAQVSLCVLPWLDRSCEVLASLYVWRTKGLGATIALRRPRFSDVVKSVEDTPLVQPRASDVLAISDARAREGVVEVRAANSTLDLCTISHSDAAVAMWSITQAMPHGSNRVNVNATGVAIPLLQELARVGATTLEEADGGEMTVALNMERLRLTSIQQMVSPMQAIRLDGYQNDCKLDLVAALVRRGWSPVVMRALEPYTPDRELMFLNDMRRPCSYFKCLLLAAALFQKGIVRVEHDLKDLILRATQGVGERADGQPGGTLGPNGFSVGANFLDFTKGPGWAGSGLIR